MTARQERRSQQKAERKAQKREHRRQNQLVEQLATEADAIKFDQAPQLPPVSNRKLAANRANSQLSTGPRSEAGRAVVAQNRVTHGLTGSFRVLADECQDDFNKLLAALMREHAPADVTETEFVQQMAEALWLSRRSVRLQDACIVALQSGDKASEESARKNLALYLRYQVTHDRAFVRFSTELRKRRNERRRIERGFESQKARQELQARRQTAENRKKELHELAVLLKKAKIEGARLRATTGKMADVCAGDFMVERKTAQQAAPGVTATNSAAI